MQEQNKETYLLGSVSFMREWENQPFLQLTQHKFLTSGHWKNREFPYLHVKGHFLISQSNNNNKVLLKNLSPYLVHF